MNQNAETLPGSILIVDDEPVNLKLLGAHLQKSGYAVSEAADGRQALQRALEKLPDLILLDIMMPGMDGIEVCRRLKEDEATQDIPVIFLSALSDSEIKAKGLEVGGVDYISKPFDSRELLARVRTHLTIKRQEQQIRSYAGNLEDMVRQRTSELSLARREIERDFEMQSVIAALMRFSLDTVDLDALLQHTLDRILPVETFSFFPHGSIFLKEGQNAELRLAACRKDGKPPDDWQEALAHCTPPSEDFSRFQQGEAEDWAPFVAEADGAIRHYCVPILSDERFLGLISIQLKEGREPDEKERGFLSAVADTLARVILYKRAQARLMESEEQYRAIFENTGTAMAIVGRDGAIELVNSGFESLVGLGKEEIEGTHNLLDFFHHEHHQTIKGSLVHLMTNNNESFGGKEFRFLTHSRGERIVTCIESSIPGMENNVVSISDITDRKRAEEQVLHHAFHDALTGLPNRTFLLDRLAQAAEKAARDPEYSFAVLLMDLDRFNLVNESLGHDIGDQLIIELAQRLQVLLGQDSLIVRLGGDEFVILVENFKDIDEVTALASRILALVRQPFQLENNELVSTSSIGIASSALEYERGEDLLRDADTALHRAKQRGKARYEVFDKEMHLKAKNLLALVTDMRQALQREEFLLHYQPIVSLADNTVHGFEALVRWRHPTHGMVSPGEFIPEAEESGLIIPIGQWVLREACDTMHGLIEELKYERCPLLSVNLSGKQFSHEDIYLHVRQILEETGYDPRCLKLEITESAIMEDAAAATEMLHQLKSLQLHVSIDDFGTGYSSLSYLHRFPVDMLKIDRSFVSSMGASGENVEIVRTIVALAHNLGLKVIAEGVETAEQVSTIAGLGCEYAQGYYFSRPVDKETLVQEDLFRKKW